MSAALKFELELEVLSPCYNCGVVQAIPANLHRRFLEKGQPFFCTDALSTSERRGDCGRAAGVIDYYSCAPGYCRACAHDPRWTPLG